jgi:hypothetical protein
MYKLQLSTTISSVFTPHVVHRMGALNTPMNVHVKKYNIYFRKIQYFFLFSVCRSTRRSPETAHPPISCHTCCFMNIWVLRNYT